MASMKELEILKRKKTVQFIIITRTDSFTIINDFTISNFVPVLVFVVGRSEMIMISTAGLIRTKLQYYWPTDVFNVFFSFATFYSFHPFLFPHLISWRLKNYFQLRSKISITFKINNWAILTKAIRWGQ